MKNNETERQVPQPELEPTRNTLSAAEYSAQIQAEVAQARQLLSAEELSGESAEIAAELEAWMDRFTDVAARVRTADYWSLQQDFAVIFRFPPTLQVNSTQTIFHGITEELLLLLQKASGWRQSEQHLVESVLNPQLIPVLDLLTTTSTEVLPAFWQQQLDERRWQYAELTCQAMLDEPELSLLVQTLKDSLSSEPAPSEQKSLTREERILEILSDSTGQYAQYEALEYLSARWVYLEIGQRREATAEAAEVLDFLELLIASSRKKLPERLDIFAFEQADENRTAVIKLILSDLAYAVATQLLTKIHQDQAYDKAFDTVLWEQAFS